MGLTLAIVGRPNVGKSTLFNRLVGRRLALVNDRPGVTRDYREGLAQIGGIEFTLLDTAGMEQSSGQELSASLRRMTEQAVRTADICLLLIDARAGLLPHDRETAEFLRRQSKPVLLAVNKCEGCVDETVFHEAFELGLGDALRISAEHGEGMGQLLTSINAAASGLLQAEGFGNDLEANDVEPGALEGPMRIAVIGRPNSGKSSLINRIVGSERLLTGPAPGVTRDAISVNADWCGLRVRIHDTAGIRKKAKVTDKLERLSVSDGLRAVRFAEIVLLVIDAEIPFETQDLRIADLAEQEGRSIVVAANKWDKIKDKRHSLAELNLTLEKKLPNIRGAGLVPVSALTGYGLARLKSEVEAAWKTWNTRVATGQLNRWLEAMTAVHPPPAPQGRRIRLRYITQIKARPPSFVIMCSQPSKLPEGYLRYLKNGLRRNFGLDGTPIRIHLRSQAHKNPFV